MPFTSQMAIELAERGLMPDFMVRSGIRQQLRERLTSLPLNDDASAARYVSEFERVMTSSPIAVLPEKANEQHYELPPAFFSEVLGSHMKYSCCFWPHGIDNLDEAEAAALQTTCEHAELANVQRILELGCGWGSLTLWMAEHYPGSRITAVSNSSAQRAYILERAARAGLRNVEVITADMNEFDTQQRFDRVVSVEMFEHMRNWPRLFEKVAGWLNPAGRFFMHVFCHRSLPYLFEVQNDADWMSRHFFSGGMMPSHHLPMRLQGPLRAVRHWNWNGRHYERTANAWLDNMDRNKPAVWAALEAAYGASDAAIWWVRWRIFFMACAELFGYCRGEEWFVGHYLFRLGDGPPA